jgi:hypothetical protein
MTVKARANLSYYSGVAMAMLGAGVWVVARLTASTTLAIVAVALLAGFVALAIVSIVTNRCPHCRRFIDLRGSAAFCPRCGGWIPLQEWDVPPLSH